MDGNNQEQEAQNQEIVVKPPTAKRLRQDDDDEPKREHGPKIRIRQLKTNQTRRPITKKTPTGKLNLFLTKYYTLFFLVTRYYTLFFLDNEVLYTVLSR